MRLRDLLLVSVASLNLFAGAAMAADETPITTAPEVTIADDAAAGGWYVRGDFGYAPWLGDETPSYRLDDAGGALISSGDFDSTRFSKPFSAGGGIGYQFTDIWRADLTADFFKSDFTGSVDTDQPCVSSGASGTGCAYGVRADVK